MRYLVPRFGCQITIFLNMFKAFCNKVSDAQNRYKLEIMEIIMQGQAGSIPTLGEIQDDIVKRILNKFYLQLKAECSATGNFSKELDSVVDRIKERMKMWEKGREDAFIAYSKANQEFDVS